MAKIAVKPKTILLPKGLSEKQLMICKRCFESYFYIDSPEFVKRTAVINLFRENIDISETEKNWLKFLVTTSGVMNIDILSTIKLDTETRSVLSAKEEKILFLQYNYARMRVCKIVEQNANKKSILKRDTLRLLHWHDKAGEARSKITYTNLGLCRSVIERSFSGLYAHREIDNIFLETMHALVRAIDGFDVGRGFKFSTYAWSAIKKAVSRELTSSGRRMATIFSETDYVNSDYNDRGLEVVYNHPPQETVFRNDEIDCLRKILDQNTANLTKQELFILEHRFFVIGDNGTGETLDAVGHKLELTKERVRQIQNIAIYKVGEILKKETGFYDRKEINEEIKKEAVESANT